MLDKITRLKEELEELQKSPENETEHVDLLNRLATLHHEISGKGGDHKRFRQEATLYSARALSLARKIDYKKGEALALSNHAMGFFHLNQYSKSLEIFKQALQLFRQTDSRYGEAETLNRIGAIYWNLGDYEKAVDFYMKSLRIKEELGNKKSIALSLNNLGLVFSNLGKVDEALSYLLQALQLKEEMDDTATMPSTLNNIGIVYRQRTDYQKSLEYYTRALRMKQDANDTKGIGFSLINISLVHQQMGDYDQAIQSCRNALNIFDTVQDRWGLAHGHYVLGDLFIDSKDREQAESLLLEALQRAEELEKTELVASVLNSLTRLYEKHGDYRQAFERYRASQQIRERMNNEKVSKKIAELQIKYETERKEKEAELARKEAEIFRLRNSELDRLNRELKLQNKKNALVNQKISEQYNQLDNLNQELRELNATKDKFFSIIVHDLKNPLHNLKLLSEVLCMNLDRMDIEKTRKHALSMNQEVENISSLLENLLHWANAHKGTIPCNPSMFPIRDALQETLTLISSPAREKGISILPEPDDDALIFADWNMILVILRNLLTNAVKFTPENGQIRISSVAGNETLSLFIEDNGIGIPPSTMKRLFRLDEHISTAGTANETGTGLGLILCMEFVHKLGGTIVAESFHNGSYSASDPVDPPWETDSRSGTRFSIELPARRLRNTCMKQEQESNDQPVLPAKD